MKNVNSLFILFIVIISMFLCSCIGTGSETISVDPNNYVVNYNDELSFETALNNGENVEGKVVHFAVKEYAEYSIWGHNCQSGEHLNFISDDNLDVKEGDYIDGYITKQPTSHAGMWKINYMPLSINPQFDEIQEVVEVEQETEKEIEKKTEDTNVELVIDDVLDIPISGTDCLGFSYTIIEKKFKNAGFTNVITKSTEFDSSSTYTKGSVVSISINGSEIFNKGDKFGKDAYIEIEYAVIKEETKISPEKETASSTSVEENGSNNTTSTNDKQTTVEEAKEQEYIITEMTAVMYVTQTVNVRKKPDLNGEKVGSLNLNDEVTVTGIVDNGWYRIKYGNTEAFVKGGYFSETKIETQAVVVVPIDGGNGGGSGDGSNFNIYDNPEQQQTELTYVLNTNTMKFHYPSCKSVKKIKPENYSPSNKSRDELISMGYSPCGNCHP